MLSRTRILVAVLGVAVAGLGIALAIVVAADSDDDNDNHVALMRQSGYPGMMGAMGAMDSAAMLQHMKEVLGEDGFQTMQDHLRAHQQGGPLTGNTGLDQMMHTMMDGMMAQMGLVPAAAGTPTHKP